MKSRGIILFGLVGLLLGCATQPLEAYRRAGQRKPTVVDYNPSHQEDVLEILFQDIELILGPSWTAERIEDFKKTYKHDNLDDEKIIKQVAIVGDKVVGYAAYFIEADTGIISVPSQDELCPGCTEEEHTKAISSYLKKVREQAPKYIDLSYIAISRDRRGSGVGKVILAHIEDDIHGRWPDVKILRSAVSKENVRAQHFFKKLGFVETPYYEGFVKYEKEL